MLQVYVPVGQPLSVELRITDLNQNSRRFFLSSGIKEANITALHSSIPLTVKRGIWNNLCFDMGNMVSQAFPGFAFASLNAITLSGTLKLRKVFTTKSRPPDTTGDGKREFIKILSFSLILKSSNRFQEPAISH